MSVETTLSIVKPDAVGRGLIGEILKRFESAGLKIVGAKLVHLTPERAQAFYAIHKERPFFPSLCTYMSSGPIFVSVLEGEAAIAKNRGIMGATDPPKRRPDRFAGLARRQQNACMASMDPILLRQR
jgi:nucleoside-diphosphate kinase